ncbi:hypothetical protein CCYA_CCYA06G1834 [Cyanidiococcus yangmingshanensis]|nr:hypothetical protein CCYA_CCYA06G1834 [Cyanidiococcus yangmingshanensis]
MKVSGSVTDNGREGKRPRSLPGERQAQLRTDLPRLARLIELGVCTQIPAAREEAYNRLLKWVDRFNGLSEASVTVCGVVFQQLQQCLVPSSLRSKARSRMNSFPTEQGKVNSRVLVHLLVLLARLVNHFTRQTDEDAGRLGTTRFAERRLALLEWLAARIFALIDAIIISGVERIALASLPAPESYAKAARDRLIALVYLWRSRFSDLEDTFEQAYIYTFDMLRVQLPIHPEAILRPRFYQQQRELQASLQVQIPALVERLTREYYIHCDEGLLQSLWTRLSSWREMNAETKQSVSLTTAQDLHQRPYWWLTQRAQLEAISQWLMISRAQLHQKRQHWMALALPAPNGAQESIETPMRELEARLSTLETRMSELWRSAEELGLETCADGVAARATASESVVLECTENTIPNDDEEYADVDFVVAEDLDTRSETSPPVPTAPGQPTTEPPHDPHSTTIGMPPTAPLEHDAHEVRHSISLGPVHGSFSRADNEVGTVHFTLSEQINRRGVRELERMLGERIIPTNQDSNEHILRALEAVQVQLQQSGADPHAQRDCGPNDDPLEGFCPVDLEQRRRRKRFMLRSKVDEGNSTDQSRKRLATHLRQRFARAQQRRIQREEDAFEQRRRDRRA